MSDAESPVGSPADPINERKEDSRDDTGDASDRDSDLLSEIDEDQFEDYDPTTAQIEERPTTIDEDVAKTLKASKRKRTEGDAPKKPKEGRREKKRRRADDDDDEVYGEVIEGKRSRKGQGTGGERRSKKAAPVEEVNEESLTPEERRQRELDRVIANATKPTSSRRKKRDDIDLEAQADEQIAELKIKMENACIADNDGRDRGQPAVEKLKLLPQVVSLLNRNDIQDTILDPDTNFLQSVRFFLEPLNDGSLPAYNIRRDIFMALTQLPIRKEMLLSSGIGKVVLFYTRSKRVEDSIKRMAEKLLSEWSRPILKRTDDFKKRHIETRDFDYHAAKKAERDGSQYTLTQRPAGSQSRFEAEKERALAPVIANPNRAQRVGLPQAYTVAPKSTFDGTSRPEFRPIGAGGLEAFRKMTQKKGRKN